MKGNRKEETKDEIFRKKGAAKVLNIAQVRKDENQDELVDFGGFRRVMRAKTRLEGVKDWVVGQEKEVSSPRHLILC